MHQVFHTVVFAAAPNGGNPCPVVLDADELCVEEMQRMTKEWGQESVFLQKPTLPNCDVKARYFVPLHEMEMCIHATVASTRVLLAEARFKKNTIWFETSLGPIPVRWQKQHDGSIEVGVGQFLPKVLAKTPSAQEVCSVLGIREGALLEGRPIRSVSTSRQKLIVPLQHRETLDQLSPKWEALWSLCDRYETTGLYVFAPGLDQEGKPIFFARQFPKRAGYNEDPATGVAASALGAYLAIEQFLPAKTGWNRFVIYQGFAMGRPSVLLAEVLLERGRIAATQVCGKAEIV